MKPLKGIRILAIEQFGAGPYGSLLLADLGADVIKVENVDGGDAARNMGPYMLGPNDSEYFHGWNLNKRSVCLDLKSPGGRQAFEKLLVSADAVMNNLRGDQPAKLGIDYASLKHLKPAIVCAHISAYGRDNDRASRPGYDYLMQAEAGLMSITGDDNGPPTRFGPSIIDQITGSVCMVGLLAALLGAKNTGRGCDVDASLFDVALHQLSYIGTWYLNEGYETKRLPRSAHFSQAPVQTFPTADGWIFIMCMTSKFWVTLCNKIGREDLLADPRFQDASTRGSNRVALSAVLDPIFKTKPSSFWIDELSQLLPISPVYTLAEALESDFVRRSGGMVDTVDHPYRPEFKVLANPIKINGQRLSRVACAAFGENTEELTGMPARREG